MDKQPRILFVDVETNPLLVWVFGLFNQNIGIDDIEQDKSIISWAAKWRGEKRIHQMDLRDSDITKDKRILKPLYKLISEADIIVAHNGNAFDIKEINARLQINGFKPPPPPKTEDTKVMAKKTSRHTSNKLEYLARVFGLKNQKSKHSSFPGKRLWIECNHGNPAAWREMAAYNKTDVVVLEELWERLIPWSGGTYSQYVDHGHLCKCGSKHLQKRGFRVTKTGRFQAFQCLECGSWSSHPDNLIDTRRRRSVTR